MPFPKQKLYRILGMQDTDCVGLACKATLEQRLAYLGHKPSCSSTYISLLAIIMGGCYERQPIRRRALWKMKKQCFFHCLHPLEGSNAGHEQNQAGEHYPWDSSGGAALFNLMRFISAIVNLNLRTSTEKSHCFWPAVLIPSLAPSFQKGLCEQSHFPPCSMFGLPMPILVRFQASRRFAQALSGLGSHTSPIGQAWAILAN